MSKGQLHPPSKKKYPVPRDRAIDVSVGHFFMTPNALIRRFAAAMKPDGVSVYMALKTFTTDDDPSCFPSYLTLAKMTGISRRQVLRSIDRLESLGLIAVHHRRRTDTNIYIILALPPASDTDAPASDSPSLVKTSASDSQSLALVTNSHQTSDSQSPKEYPPKKTHLKKTHTTTPTPPQPMAPISETVVEVVEAVAIAQGEETTATDGGMASAGVTPFEQFFVAYPQHRAIQKARKTWEALNLDAMLPTILEALSWQKTLTGNDALPLYPHVYLENKGWLDAPPSASARPRVNGDGTVIYPTEIERPRCKVPDCPNPPEPTLSDTKCEMHAMATIEEEATRVIRALKEHDSGALIDELEDAVWGEVSHYHKNGDWHEVMDCVTSCYQNIGEGL
jgi:hypothetical protein